MCCCSQRTQNELGGRSRRSGARHAAVDRARSRRGPSRVGRARVARSRHLGTTRLARPCVRTCGRSLARFSGQADPGGCAIGDRRDQLGRRRPTATGPSGGRGPFPAEYIWPGDGRGPTCWMTAPAGVPAVKPVDRRIGRQLTAPQPWARATRIGQRIAALAPLVLQMFTQTALAPTPPQGHGL